MENIMFNELTNDELENVEGGLVSLLMFGGVLIGFTLSYRDEIAAGLCEGYMSTQK